MQKTAYEMRISDWSSDVCSSDLPLTSGMIGNLGVMYLRAGNAKGAEEAFREALRIRQKNLPGDHWKVADMQSQLGAALAAQGQLDAAEPLLKAASATLQQALGEEERRTLPDKTRPANMQEEN